MPGNRRLAAIMFTDMVSYAALTQKDERLALGLLEEHRGILRPIFREFAGNEVKTMGDGFLVEFASAIQAVECAVKIQNALKRRNAASAERRSISLRIGIHVGDIMGDGTDIAGDGVNIAARIEPIAPPGGICISRQVFDQVAGKVSQSIVKLGARDLKHIRTPVEIYRVLLTDDKQRPRSGPAVPGAKHRIAVLPLANISPDPNDEYFADGMTEELISTLSRMEGLSVIARTSVMRFKNTTKRIVDIGDELDVESVLEGSVRKVGNHVRISAKLVDARDEEHVWSQEYDRDLQDIFKIQSDISSRIAGSLKLKIIGAKGRPEATAATPDIEAYQCYLKGRYFWNKRSEPALKTAIGYFQDALESDPRYALAYTGLADSYAVLALFELLPPKEAYPKAKKAVRKALRIDNDLAEAHTSLGLAKFQYDWDWPGAEEEFSTAISISPNYAPAHHFYADYLKARGRFDEALQQIREAQELDPLSLAISTGVGHVLYLSRRYDDAIEQYQKTVELDPSFMQTHLWFGRPYLQKGMYTEAISELQKAVNLSGESTVSLAMLGHAYAAAGQEESARQVLRKLTERSRRQYVPSYWIAVIHNGFKDKGKVFEWLERAYQERSSWLAWIGVEPRFDWLKGEPKFQALIRRMRL